MRNASSIFLLAGLMLSLPAAQAQWITKKTSPEVYDSLRTATLNEVSLVASRPGASVPMPQLRLKPADLAKQNVGRDIPFLLQGMPSFTAASDAGNGFGYTYLRFRGMDQTRINVTVNNVA
ncbi:MAG: Plug domain-containing protein, partial [Schleiferiaceae bacterium]|nr:Plug domain-containing protein [Schleiferiaceae bacterium]MDP4628456.1 Plug domain-containing protein [Schleiferiaceae bacterium]MDP4932183.1 Plug domain-containing protein [Schleiferiaceae bacterium]